jgi:hypothetical protein
VAGPEPYPQEKWTPEQEAAYAEGRKSATGKGSQGPAPRSGKKRVVRTAAGAKRYKVPIGAEIGTARNASAAQAQKDTESTGRYTDLVGQDRGAQATAMKGLNDDQLQRLSRVAYSFPSSDPNVVRLRLGVAAELQRRGMNVNDFGGLGKGSARATGPTKGKLKPKAKGKVAPNPNSSAGIQAAMTRMYGNKKPARTLRKNLSMPQLRQALGAFSKVASGKREVVAKYLVNQAIELGVPHMLGRSILDASGRAAEVIELAGKWKHGYIPLDAAALASKMKGRTGGKQWWTGGARSGKGSGGTKGRLHDAVGIPKGSGKSAPAVKRGGLTNAQTGNRFAARSRGSDGVRKQVAEHNKVAGSQAARDKRTAFFQQRAQMGTPAQKQGLGYTHHKADGTSEFVKTGGAKRKPGVSGKPSNLRRSIEAGKQIRGSKDRTNVVKSSSKPNERGSKMNRNEMLDEMATLSGKKNKTEADKARMQELRGLIGAKNQQVDARKKARGPEHIEVSSYGKIPHPSSKPQAEPFPAAASFLEKHGADKAKEKLAALKAKRDDLKAMRRKTTSVDLEIKGLENVLARDSERKFQAQKSRSRLTPEQLAKRGFTGNGSSGKA